LFFPELLAEGYSPHEVEEVWLSLTHQPDITLNVTEYWQDRIEALKNHESQIGDPQAFEQYMLDRVRGDQQEDLVYEEKFRRIKFRRKTHDDS
jgi:LmbE family N-acetylglucosaminyl deacetylase